MKCRVVLIALRRNLRRSGGHLAVKSGESTDRVYAFCRCLLLERRVALIQLLAPNEVMGSIGKEGVVLVFSTQDGIGNGHAPVDVESLV